MAFCRVSVRFVMLLPVSATMRYLSISFRPRAAPALRSSQAAAKGAVSRHSSCSPHAAARPLRAPWRSLPGSERSLTPFWERSNGRPRAQKVLAARLRRFPLRHHLKWRRRTTGRVVNGSWFAGHPEWDRRISPAPFLGQLARAVRVRPGRRNMKDMTYNAGDLATSHLKHAGLSGSLTSPSQLEARLLDSLCLLSVRRSCTHPYPHDPLHVFARPPSEARVRAQQRLEAALYSCKDWGIWKLVAAGSSRNCACLSLLLQNYHWLPPMQCCVHATTTWRRIFEL